MGFIKWLKRDGYFSPSAKSALSDSASSPVSSVCKKSKLTRNESYLKALTRFCKWRQLHLSSTNGNLNASDSEYEEVHVDLNATFNRSILKGLNYEAATSTKIAYSPPMLCDNKFRCHAEAPRNTKEPEYALPFSNSDDELYAPETWKPLYASPICLTEARIVTDLDISTAEQQKGSGSSFKIGPDLLICGHADIRPSVESVDGSLGHCQVDGIDVGCIRNGDYDAMWHIYRTLGKLRHPNIILLMGVSLSERGALTALLVEPVKCSLYESIHWQKNIIPTQLCLAYTMQLTNAVIYLHKRLIVHTNISSPCVLICNDINYVKLSGFEQSVTQNDVTAPNAVRSKIAHHGQVYSGFESFQCKTDVYGLCITLWEMLNCMMPYFQSSENSMLPMYEKDRCSPFKCFFDRGLQVESAVELNSELQQVHLSECFTNRRSVASTMCSQGHDSLAENPCFTMQEEFVTPKRKLNVSIRIASNRSWRNRTFSVRD